MKFSWIAGAAVLLGAPMPAQAAIIYSNNYDGTTSTAAGVTVGMSAGGAIVSSLGANAGGITGNTLWNKSQGNPAGLTQYTFTGVANYSSFDVDFLLAFVDSWDSTNGGGGSSPDRLRVIINGVDALGSLTAANTSGTVNQNGGGTVTSTGSNVFAAGYNDRVLNMGTASGLSFANTGGNVLTIGIQASGNGWQGGNDESWAIDNFVLNGTLRQGAVPEPATWAMMMLGFAAVGAAMRRGKVQTRVSFA